MGRDICSCVMCRCLCWRLSAFVCGDEEEEDEVGEEYSRKAQPRPLLNSATHRLWSYKPTMRGFRE